MTSSFPIDSKILREAIGSVCQITNTTTDPGKVADALVTYSQAKALDYKTSVVRGGRGSGKSFWWAALQSEDHRRWIANALGPKLSRAENLTVIPGFGISMSESYPSPRLLENLAKEHLAHLEDIWTTVLLKQALPKELSPYEEMTNWSARVTWTATNVERVEGLMRKLEQLTTSANAHLLIAFDGLDRLAGTWTDIRPLARSILRFALHLQSSSRIRAKVFLRPDMFDDSQIVAFPDASKLLDGHASLNWTPVELYSLFFQRLANADVELAAQAFREGAEAILSNGGYPSAKWNNKGGVWDLPAPIKTEAKAQRELFHALTGEAMSHNQSSVKRGYPYTWLPNHLADSHGELSPRSFLAALREAADVTPPSTTSRPLYFTGIQQGVSAASATRVGEIKEDYPWLNSVMGVLSNRINVPCDQSELFALWKEEEVLSAIAQSGGNDSDEFSAKLGPADLTQNKTEDLFENLVRLGIFSRQAKERVQMPDVYRVAFGIGRRGGIPPIRQAAHQS